MAAFGFGFPSLNFNSPIQRPKKKQPTPGISKALHSSVHNMSNVGVGITTQLRIPTKTTLKKAARAVGHQPFDLSGRRRPPPPAEPVDKFRHKAKQVSHQPFLKGAPPPPILTPSEKFSKKANQLAHQPFKVVITPPRLNPSELFAMKANQIAHQPFRIGGKVVAPKNRFKIKAKSIGQLAAHPLFRHALVEESKKAGRFKSLSRAIIRTSRMFSTTEAIKHAARMENDLIGSNKEEIKSGKYPLLKKEVLTLLFEYLPVPDLKTGRLVCEFWKRFATVALQRKSRVKLSGICDLCKSEWMSEDESIPAHDHAQTISFYRFVLFIQDIDEQYRYFMPFRNFKIKKINLYFIRGINTAPTRIFLMFLKLWGERIHELHLQAIQMTPPDAFYRIVDCCKRVKSITFDDIKVWVDPLADSESTNAAKFSMHINYYLESITFLTNWIGEELLHWQMILQAFPCLQELNLIDVARTEINHCLTALLNLPEKEEEEIELRKVGGFKQLSRKVMRIPFNFNPSMDDQASSLPSFKTVTRLLVDMPFITNRLKKLQAMQEDDPKKFKKFAQKLHSQPFQLSRRSNIVPRVTPGKLKGVGRQLMHQPFRIPPKAPSPEPGGVNKFKGLARIAQRSPFGSGAPASGTIPEEDGPEGASERVGGRGKFKGLAGKAKKSPFGLAPGGSVPEDSPENASERVSGGAKFKGLAGKAKKSPFGLGTPPGTVAEEGAENASERIGGIKKFKGLAGNAARKPWGISVRSDEDENVQNEDGKTPYSSKFKLKTKSVMNQPFRLSSQTEGGDKKKSNKVKFKSGARNIINQPFTLINPSPDLTPEVFTPKPKSFKSQVNKVIQPFEIMKTRIKPLERFRNAAKKVGNQPFNLGEPIPHEKVLPGSILHRINVSTRRNYEDQLKADLEERERQREILEAEEQADEEEEEEEDEEESYYSDEDNDVEIREEEEEEDEVSESDNQSIQDSDFNDMETYELIAEAVYRFDIKQVTLRVNYTEEDAGTFTVVLEACRTKVTSITLNRHAKVYFSELDLKFLVNPFETPEETIMDFPTVTKLSLAHNIVGHINEIRDSFPALVDLTINIVTTEFLRIKNKPYKTYVRTNMILSMKFGKAMPTVRTLVWNIQDSRHPFTQKRTLVYKCNAIRYVPRIFPNLSKLTLSITTAHELHVIFRECTQLHDLIVLKNSFYRTKDTDIVGQDEDEEEKEQILDELDPDNYIDPITEKVRTLHPTRIINQGIKQLKFLRRLSLENNNCCLTNTSVEYGFIHLRRLRSIHISRCKRIELRALRLLKRCRFLVRVSITKEKLKTQIPIPLEGEDPEENDNQLHLPGIPTQVQTVPGLPNVYIFQSSLTDSKYIAKPQGGFQTWTKYDKIGGKRFDYVTTTYEVNGRQYSLIRRQYEGQEYNRDIWERKFRLAELRQREEDSQRAIEDMERSAEIDPTEMIRQAETKRLKEVQDEESDCERFMNEYDDDYEDDEDGYRDEDEELLLEEQQRLQEEEEQSSDEDGICLEADTMYEGEKEDYDDTDSKSSDDGESYCDSATEGEYQADKETCDASDDAGKQADQTEGKSEDKEEEEPSAEVEIEGGKAEAGTSGDEKAEEGPSAKKSLKAFLKPALAKGKADAAQAPETEPEEGPTERKSLKAFLKPALAKGKTDAAQAPETEPEEGPTERKSLKAFLKPALAKGKADEDQTNDTNTEEAPSGKKSLKAFFKPALAKGKADEVQTVETEPEVSPTERKSLKAFLKPALTIGKTEEAQENDTIAEEEPTERKSLKAFLKPALAIGKMDESQTNDPNIEEEPSGKKSLKAFLKPALEKGRADEVEASETVSEGRPAERKSFKTFLKPALEKSKTDEAQTAEVWSEERPPGYFLKPVLENRKTKEAQENDTSDEEKPTERKSLKAFLKPALAIGKIEEAQENDTIDEEEPTESKSLKAFLKPALVIGKMDESQTNDPNIEEEPTERKSLKAFLKPALAIGKMDESQTNDPNIEEEPSGKKSLKAFLKPALAKGRADENQADETNPEESPVERKSLKAFLKPALAKGKMDEPKASETIYEERLAERKRLKAFLNPALAKEKTDEAEAYETISAERLAEIKSLKAIFKPALAKGKTDRVDQAYEGKTAQKEARAEGKTSKETKRDFFPKEAARPAIRKETNDSLPKAKSTTYSTTSGETASADVRSTIATAGSSYEKEILERTSLELLKNLKEVAQKQLRAKEKSKIKESREEGTKDQRRRKKSKEKTERKEKSKEKSKKAGESKSNVSHSKLEYYAESAASASTRKVLSWKTDETRDIEYMESLRRVSLSSHGPSHMSPVPVPGSHPYYSQQDLYYDSPPTIEAGTSAPPTKPNKKDKKHKSRKHQSKDENLDMRKLRKQILQESDDSRKKYKSKEDTSSKRKRDKSQSQERVRTSKMGRESPSDQAAPIEVLGDLRQQLIKNMVTNVKKEMKK